MVVNRKLLLVAGAGVLIISIVLLVLHGSKPAVSPPPNPAPTTGTKGTASSANTLPSDDDLIEVIGDADNPGMTYVIDDVHQPAPGWYVVKVTASNEYGTFHQIAVVHKNSDGSLEDIAGPDVSFPITFLQSTGMPQAVLNLVPSYQP